jgi:hypothetical protein
MIKSSQVLIISYIILSIKNKKPSVYSGPDLVQLHRASPPFRNDCLKPPSEHYENSRPKSNKNHESKREEEHDCGASPPLRGAGRGGARVPGPAPMPRIGHEGSISRRRPSPLSPSRLRSVVPPRRRLLHADVLKASFAGCREGPFTYAVPVDHRRCDRPA